VKSSITVLSQNFRRKKASKNFKNILDDLKQFLKEFLPKMLIQIDSLTFDAFFFIEAF
jgi:hypothetical protein